MSSVILRVVTGTLWRSPRRVPSTNGETAGVANKKKKQQIWEGGCWEKKHSLDLWKSTGNPENFIFYMYLAILLVCRESSVSWPGRHRFESRKRRGLANYQAQLVCRTSVISYQQFLPSYVSFFVKNCKHP